MRTKAAAVWSAASAAADISTDAASLTAADAIAATGMAVSGSAARNLKIAATVAGRKRQIEAAVIRRSPRSPKKKTAVLPPAGNVSVDAVAPVQHPASAEASSSAEGVASVPAASLVSMSFFVRFVLSKLIYTNSYLLRYVCILFRICQLV